MDLEGNNADTKIVGVDIDSEMGSVALRPNLQIGIPRSCTQTIPIRGDADTANM